MASEEKHSDAWWTGYLSQALKEALRDLDCDLTDHAKRTIQRTLRNWEERDKHQKRSISNDCHHSWRSSPRFSDGGYYVRCTLCSAREYRSPLKENANGK